MYKIVDFLPFVVKVDFFSLVARSLAWAISKHAVPLSHNRPINYHTVMELILYTSKNHAWTYLHTEFEARTSLMSECSQ